MAQWWVDAGATPNKEAARGWLSILEKYSWFSITELKSKQTAGKVSLHNLIPRQFQFVYTVIYEVLRELYIVFLALRSCINGLFDPV